MRKRRGRGGGGKDDYINKCIYLFINDSLNCFPKEERTGGRVGRCKEGKKNNYCYSYLLTVVTSKG